MDQKQKRMKKALLKKLCGMCGIGSIVMAGILTSALTRALAASSGEAPMDPTITMWAFITAAACAAIGSVAAGIAVAYVGSAAVGAIGEKPELAGRALIFVGLAEGIAIYGLIIAIMILGKI